MSRLYCLVLKYLCNRNIRHLTSFLFMGTSSFVETEFLLFSVNQKINIPFVNDRLFDLISNCLMIIIKLDLQRSIAKVTERLLRVVILGTDG